MAVITKSVEIDRPVETVFDYVVAQWEGRLEFWSRGIESWTPSASPLRVGFQVRYVGRMLGVGMPVEMEVVDFSRPRGWTAVSRRGAPVRGDWSFQAVGQRTRFTYRLAYEMPPPMLGPMLDRLLLAGQWRRIIDESLANLKRRVETPVQGAA